jgi:hypothetical protein
MQTNSVPSVSEQVDKIRDAIRRTGSCTIGCEALTLLRPENGSWETRKRAVKQIAEWEGWAIHPLATNEVRFCWLPPTLCLHEHAVP